MNLPVAALFTRALRVETRQLSTYGFRLILIIVILFGLMGAQQASRFTGAPGLQFFRTVIMINFFVISLFGLQYFASAITEEKEEQALGLLRMTALSPVAILLGKSTSRLLGILLVILGQLPFTLLAITLGGVALHQVIAAYAALLAYFVFLANISLVISVMSRNARSAAGLAGIVVLAYFFLPVMIVEMIKELTRNRTRGFFTDSLYSFSSLIRDTSVFERLMKIMRTGFSESVFSFQVISNLIMGIAFFGLSWLLFDRFTRYRAPAGPSRGLISRKKKGILRIFGMGRPWPIALAWKDFHFMTGGRVGLIARGGLLLFIGLLAGITTALDGRFEADIVGVAIMVTGYAGLAIEGLFFASRLFSDEVRWKTLSDLVLLPRSVQALAYHKFLGLMPVIVLWAGGICIGALFAFREAIQGLEELLSLGGFVGLIIYVFMMHWVAFLSLYVKRGALIIGFISAQLGASILMPIFVFTMEEAGFVVLMLLLGGFTVFLHIRIGHRIQVLAGRE